MRNLLSIKGLRVYNCLPVSFSINKNECKAIYSADTKLLDAIADAIKKIILPSDGEILLLGESIESSNYPYNKIITLSRDIDDLFLFESPDLEFEFIRHITAINSPESDDKREISSLSFTEKVMLQARLQAIYSPELVLFLDYSTQKKKIGEDEIASYEKILLELKRDYAVLFLTDDKRIEKLSQFYSTYQKI